LTCAMSPLPGDSSSGKMGLSGRSLLWAQAISLAGFAGFNIALNFYNSWLLSEQKIEQNTTLADNTTVTEVVEVEGPVNGHPNIDFPCFYTTWHMMATVLGATIILTTVSKPATGFPNFRQYQQYWWQLLAISSCSVLNILCNNASLRIVSLFLNQVIKATGPMPTMLFSFLIESKTYGWDVILSCVMIVAGTILAIPMGDGGNPTTFGGFLLVAISTLAASLKPVIMAIAMKGTPERPKLPPTVVLWYDAFISFFVMLVAALVLERQQIIDYFSGNGGGEAVGLIAAGASMAFLFNLSTYFFVLLTSALTSTVAANGVKVINIVISAIASHVSKVQNWLGVALVCLSLCAYAYFSFMAKGKPSAPAKTPFMKGGGDAEAGKAYTEATPLQPTEGANEQCCIVS